MFSFLNAEDKTKKIYSVEANVPAKDGETKPRRHYLLGADKPLIDTIDPKVTTLYENFVRSVELVGDGPFLGTRSSVGSADGAGPYVWLSYSQAFERAKKIGAFIVKQGVADKGCVGLYSVNRAEWVLAEQGCFAYSYNTVPLYDTLGFDAIKHILNQTELTLVFCSKDKINGLLENKSSLPHLTVIVSMDAVDDSTKEKAKSVGVELFFFDEAEEIGAKNPVDPRPPKRDDPATICYTSGTTGLPKGVVLTHMNILSNSMAYIYAAQQGQGYPISKNDSHISYLPLAHVFERALHGIIIYAGARIGFYRGDTLKLLDDVGELQPTIFASVPRLFNRIYDKVMAGVKEAGGLKEKLFRLAFQTKKNNLSSSVNHLLWDALVFAKIRARLGGRVKFMLSGSAPLSSEVMAFLRIAFSCEVLEGYGQTETAAGATITEVGDYSVGHVGGPFGSNEVKLVDIPEMGYLATDQPFPRGEICFRGHNTFKEYFKLPDKTAETVDADGWVHTGDVGLFDAQGRVRIVDRKKDIFKLAQGEYVASSKIENCYVNNEFVAQVFVHGDSLQSTLVGIVVPDEPILVNWAKTQDDLKDKSFADLCKNDKVKKHILATIQKHGKDNDLKGFENVKNIYLESQQFTVENDLLTPSFKIKRNEVKNKYQKQIDAMYAEINGSA